MNDDNDTADEAEVESRAVIGGYEYLVNQVSFGVVLIS